MSSALALQEDAAPPHTPRYKRLTRDDMRIIRAMDKAGKTQVEIAQALGCNQSAISRWLNAFTDSTDDAKAYLRGSALLMAQNIVKKGRAADHVKTLEGLEVLSSQDVKGGLTIVIGDSAQVQVNIGTLGGAEPRAQDVVVEPGLTASK